MSQLCFGAEHPRTREGKCWKPAVGAYLGKRRNRGDTCSWSGGNDGRIIGTKVEKAGRRSAVSHVEFIAHFKDFNFYSE